MLALTEVCGQASGLQLTLLGQRQAAMGNAGTALPLDGATAWVNPAGMNFLDRRAYVQLGGSFYRPLTSFLEPSPTFGFESMDTFALSPFHAYGVIRPRGNPRWAYGISVNSPYGAASLWPEDWKGRFISQEFRLTSLFIQPAVSYRFSSQLSVGVGVSYGLASILSRKAIDRDGQEESRSSVKYLGGGNGVGLNLGIYHVYSDKISMGLTFRTPIQIEVNQGVATFDVPQSLEEFYPEQSFQTHLPLPAKLNIGIGYRPESRLLVAVDVRYTRWQSFDSLSLVLEQEVGGLVEYPEKAWENTLGFHAGMEYLVNEKMEIRAGLAYNNSPVPDELLSPQLPDSDNIGLNGGFGLHITRDFIANFSAGYNYTGERTGFLTNTTFGGTYESISYHFGLDIQYRF